MRAYASFDRDRLANGTPSGSWARGISPFCSIRARHHALSGHHSDSGDSAAHCAEAYFAQSEQLPTRFALSFGKSTEAGGLEHWRAGGVMLQHMPKASPFATGGGSGEGRAFAGPMIS